LNLTQLAYSISEACTLTSVGRTTLYSAIKTGHLKVHKIGRRTLISANDLVAWLDSHSAIRHDATSAEMLVAADSVSKAVRS
jgi:excisionase family DNA binding protein